LNTAASGGFFECANAFASLFLTLPMNGSDIGAFRCWLRQVRLSGG
jgi:hypothetical protein